MKKIIAKLIKLKNKIICNIFGHDILVCVEGVRCNRCKKLLIKFHNLPLALNNMAKAFSLVGTSVTEFGIALKRLGESFDEYLKEKD